MQVKKKRKTRIACPEFIAFSFTAQKAFVPTHTTIQTNKQKEHRSKIWPTNTVNFETCFEREKKDHSSENLYSPLCTLVH